MLFNYKMTISYDGSRYFGWEHQPGKDLTIQGKLEQVLFKLTGEQKEVIGAGRTDAGVHALGMTANVRLDSDRFTKEALDEFFPKLVQGCLPDVNSSYTHKYISAGIRDYMNRYLPDDICILDVTKASDRFHSRYNAVGKTYRYDCYIGDTKPVFDRKYCYIPEKMPDMDRMRLAASCLIGTHDFASFCGNARMKKSTVRKVDTIDITRSGDHLFFTYHGSGFLQYMVRILTGTLLEVGYGKRSPDSIPSLIEAKKRELAGFTAPAKGLCLIKVDY